MSEPTGYSISGAPAYVLVGVTSGTCTVAPVPADADLPATAVIINIVGDPATEVSNAQLRWGGVWTDPSSYSFTITTGTLATYTFTYTNGSGKTNPSPTVVKSVYAQGLTASIDASSGQVGIARTITVSTVGGVAAAGDIIVSITDNSGGGTFDAASKTLASGQDEITFTYTPGTHGTKTINVTAPASNTYNADPDAITFTSKKVTVVERIARNIITTLGNIVEGDTYSFTVSSVERRQLTENVPVDKKAIVAVDSDEQLTETTAHQRRRQRFEILVFRMTETTGQTIDEELLETWADVTTALAVDKSRGGLAWTTKIPSATFLENAVIVDVDVEYEYLLDSLAEQE